MSINKDNKGYVVQYSVKDVVTGKLKRTKKRGFKTLKEAKEFERTLSRDKSEVTFYSLFEELQTNTQQEQDTYLGKLSVINTYLPSFKTIRYEDLTKPYLLQIRTQIAKLDLSAKTKNKILDVITSTCRYANKFYDLSDNSKVLDRFKLVKKEFDVWTPEEYFTFEKALVGTKYEDMISVYRTFFFTGLRKGELRALTVDDLDIDEMTLSVTKSMRKYKSSLKAPKTPSGVRKIKLDKNTFEMIKPLKSNEKWLFGDYKPISRDRVDKAFKFGIEKSGVKPIRIHDLRHSHASYLIMNGANIVAVSKRLGHSSINMTLSTYAHLFENSENQLIELLNVAKM